MKISTPFLFFSKDGVDYFDSLDTLTDTNTLAIKNGYYKNSMIVDHRGKAIKIRNATKVGSIGPFWGFSIFLDRRIRVQLDFKGESFDIPLEEVKLLVFRAFKKRFGWRTRGDFDELKDNIRDAKSIADIVTLLKE